MARWAQFPARRRWVVAIAAIGAVVAAGSLTFSLAGSGPQTTIVRNGEVWLQGEITQDPCYLPHPHVVPGGGGPCSITVNGYEVSILSGDLALTGTPGAVTGLDPSTDQTGRHVDVYAQLVGPHLASILSAPRYYARISG